jgi:hypothetical protein
MTMSRWWRRVPRVTAGMAAVVLVAGLASGADTLAGAPAGGSHPAGTVTQHVSHPAAVHYRGVIGAPPSAVETAAQTPAPPPVDPKVYEACLNPKLYQSLLPASTYIAGWSDASKLDGSTVVGSPTLAFGQGNPPGGGYDGASPFPVVNGEPYGCGLAKFQLNYDGQREFPPLTATFLAFGFMPVTATVYLTQVGSAPVVGLGYQFNPPGNPYTVVSTAQVSLRLSNVTVNGTPLDVGNDCHTTGPLTSPGNPLASLGPGYSDELVLTGGSYSGDPLPPYPYGIGIVGGGSLEGTATIPPFTGCVTPGGDNLNALLDASISGPDNYIKVLQGPVCYQVYNNCSPPSVPEYKPLWTVTGGGTYTASGPVAIVQNKPRVGIDHYAVVCADSSIRGTIPDARGGPLRNGYLGTVTWTRFSNCTGNQLTAIGSPLLNKNKLTPDNSTWTVTQQGPAYLNGYEYSPGSNPPTTGVTTATAVDDVTLTLQGSNVPGAQGGKCTAEINGPITLGSYANSGSKLTVGSFNPSAPQMSVISSNCPTGIFTVIPVNTINYNAADAIMTSMCSSVLGAGYFDHSSVCPYDLSRSITITSP